MHRNYVGEVQTLFIDEAVEEGPGMVGEGGRPITA